MEAIAENEIIKKRGIIKGNTLVYTYTFYESHFFLKTTMQENNLRRTKTKKIKTTYPHKS